MKIKRGATIAGLDIRMRPALVTADRIYTKYKKELVITSGLDGAHSAGSLHYYGLAIDIRTRYFRKKNRRAVYQELQSELPSWFKVVLEKNHIHIQYDAVLGR
jgi:hypothetical protein